MQAKLEAPELFNSIASLGTVLEALNYRKQLPVYVKKKGISTSMDKRTIPDLLNSGLSQDSVDIQFTTSSVNTADEQNLQVQ